MLMYVYLSVCVSVCLQVENLSNSRNTPSLRSFFLLFIENYRLLLHLSAKIMPFLIILLCLFENPGKSVLSFNPLQPSTSPLITHPLIHPNNPYPYRHPYPPTQTHAHAYAMSFITNYSSFSSKIPLSIKSISANSIVAQFLTFLCNNTNILTMAKGLQLTFPFF